MTQRDTGTITIPEAEHRIPPSSREELDAAVDAVAAAAPRWVATTIADRIALLEDSIAATLEVVEEWDEAARSAKGIARGGPYDGEDLGSGPWALIRNLRLLRDTLRDIERYGQVRFPGRPYTRHDGRVVVPVFPTRRLDAVLFPRTRAEVWLREGVTLDTMRAASNYLGPKPPPRVCFVLGAGNVAPIGVMDALHKLFAEEQTCVIKMNPVNEHMGPVLTEAVAPFVRAGFIRIVYGGAQEGDYLVHHPKVDTIHITGSDKTHDAIVFGTGEEGRRRKAEGRPLLDKPITSELGNVTPIIVVPGRWTASDLAYQAEHIVSMLTNNCGFNCAAGRMIVTHRRWAQRDALLDAIRAALRRAPTRRAYYPGAAERLQVFLDAHPDAEQYGDPGPGELPWTLIAGLDPDVEDDVAYRLEAFTSLFCEVPIDAPQDVPAFLHAATEFCNERLWGTLAATLLVHPKSLKDPEVAAAVDLAVEHLRYGSIAINAWAAVMYGFTSTPWGAYPGHTLEDIGSGIGVVHNTYLLEDTEKAVAYAPWRMGKKPPGSFDFRTMPQLVRRLIRLEATGDWRQVPGIILDGLRA